MAPRNPTAYRIEKGIPIPRRSTIITVIRKLEVGESILVPGSDLAPARVRARVNYAKYVDRDRSYTTRQMDGGTRIWRTK
jgi:hypothetical protein